MFASLFDRAEHIVAEQGRQLVRRALVGLASTFALVIASLMLTASLSIWLAELFGWPIALAATGSVWLLFAAIGFVPKTAVREAFASETKSENQTALATLAQDGETATEQADDQKKSEAHLPDVATLINYANIGFAAFPVLWRFKKYLPIFVGAFVFYRASVATSDQDEAPEKISAPDAGAELPEPSTSPSPVKVDSATWVGHSDPVH